MKNTEILPISRITENRRETRNDLVATEMPLTIFYNEKELVTILCIPEDTLFLAVGYLFSESFIQRKEDILSIKNDEKRGIVFVNTNSKHDPINDLRHTRFIKPDCFNETPFYNAADAALCKKIESNIQISSTEIIKLLKRSQNSSSLFQKTGGVHSAALFDNSDLFIFSEDLGRHNAIDKIFGKCLMKGIPLEDKIMFTSGRISSAILLKIIRARIPIIISRSASTSEAVKLAKKFGVTLIGFARGKKMNIYSNEWRIV